MNGLNIRHLTLLLAMGLPAVAQAGAEPWEVLVLGAPSFKAYNTDVRDKINCVGFFDSVDFIYVGDTTPTLADLANYDAVLVYNDIAFANTDALGDLLADYSDGGGGVVVATGTFSNTIGLGGRFATGGYMPFTKGSLAQPGDLTIVKTVPDHPALYGVNDFAGGQASVQVSPTLVTNGAVTIAEWSNFLPLVAVMDAAPGGGRVAGLNMYPPSADALNAYWDPETDGDWLMGAALLWASGFEYPIDDACKQDFLDQDFNCNGIDVTLETPVTDLTDETCAQNVDPVTGLPYDNTDYYYDYESFGCANLTDEAGFDQDLDGLGFGTIQIFATPESPFPSKIAQLVCDNCPEDFNPRQEDVDCDGFGDLCDNCPRAANPDQLNRDDDCFGDFCDNCPEVPNDDQTDTDEDGFGDICDNCPTVQNDQQDDDEDLVGDACDNCPLAPDGFNPDQADADGDAVGDVCDNCQVTVNPGQANADLDAFGDACDTCPLLNVADQTDTDGDTVGDKCDNCIQVDNILQTDNDSDGLGNACDNCPNFQNEEQYDADEDGVGDVCDVCPTKVDPAQLDQDADGLGDACDNCPDFPNEDQLDRDLDGFGDVCDLCPDSPPDEPDKVNIDRDGDGVGDNCDNCRAIPNPDQLNEDDDDRGDACDARAIRGGGNLNPAVKPQCSTTPETGLGMFAVLAVMFGIRRRRSR